MKEFIKKLNADKIIKLAAHFSFGFTLLHLSIIVVSYSHLPLFLPLFNQMPWGGERLGIKIAIFIPFLITNIFIFLNLFLALRIYEKMPLLSRILNITNVLISFLAFVFIVRTILLII